MGSLAAAAFHSMFGWVRRIFRALWRVLFQDGGSTDAFGGLTHNWLRWVLLLCVVCTVIDLAVYLFRWRPYRVWASWFRRMRGEGIEAESLEPSLYPETGDEELEEDLSGLLYEDRLDAPPEPYDQAEQQDVDEELPAAPKRVPADNRGLLRRVAAKTREIAGVDTPDADLAVRFKPEPMPVKPEQAYQQPVYPPSWKNER